MTNAAIARLLAEYADLLEVQGANVHRLRHYRTAARVLKKLPLEADRGEAGLGDKLAATVEEIAETGHFAALEELRAKLPPVVPAALAISGLGPKKVSRLVDQLQLQTVEDLRDAAESGRIAEVAGFGPKSGQTVLEGLRQQEAVSGQVLLAVAVEHVDGIIAELSPLEAVEDVHITGQLAMRQETVDQAAVVVAVLGDLETVADNLTDVLGEQELQPIEPGESVGDDLVAELSPDTAADIRAFRLTSREGLPVDLLLAPAAIAAELADLFAASPGYQATIATAVRDAGLEADGGIDSLRMQLGLPEHPPEVRTDDCDFAAEVGPLVTLEQMRGDVHMHTTASDGRDSILAMAEAAAARGYDFIAITDHSQRVSMANGLDAVRLRKHWDEIRATDAPLRVLCGIECDILEDATMDLPDDVLAEADLVIAVLHYGLRQPREQIMRRLLHAAEHPHVDIIGHPSGRILLKRPPADIDWPTLLRACRDFGTCLEINSAPPRLDLAAEHAQAAAAEGIPIVISTDAHATAQLDYMQWGVGQARRAGLRGDQVANTRSTEDFLAMLKR